MAHSLHIAMQVCTQRAAKTITKMLSRTMLQGGLLDMQRQFRRRQGGVVALRHEQRPRMPAAAPESDSQSRRRCDRRHHPQLQPLRRHAVLFGVQRRC